SLGRNADSGAADKQRARAGAAEAGGTIGVALHDSNLVDRNAEYVDRELRKRCRQSLSHRLERRHDLDVAIAAYGDGHALIENICAGPFEKCRHAASAQSAALARASESIGEAVPIGKCQRLIHDRLERA